MNVLIVKSSDISSHSPLWLPIPPAEYASPGWVGSVRVNGGFLTVQQFSTEGCSDEPA